MIKELIKFISLYDPEYPQKIHGATQAELLRLEQISHKHLPHHYREFLEHMGRDMGDFVIPNSDFNIETVLNVYEDEDWPPHPGYLFIGAITQEPYENYHLECAEENIPDSRVVRFSADANLSDSRSILVIYSSLSDMLFSWAFKDKRMSLLPAQTTLLPSLSREKKKGGASAADLLHIIGELAGRMGFQRLPYTSSHLPMYERMDAAILGHQNPTRGGIYVDVAAKTDHVLKRVVEIIRDSTPLY